jgi:outer membrane protein assembly factor BamB
MRSCGVLTPWARSLHLRSSAIAAAGGSVVVAERHRRLVCLRAHDGGQRWDRQVEDCRGTLAVAGDRCLYLSQSGVLHCFALGSGEPLWARPGLPFRRHVSVCSDVIFVGGWRG